ncbi:class I SAM-dependent methyltransferase [bacterium]|nr:class I SAM-dependent methyltransferase [bacterium]
MIENQDLTQAERGDWFRRAFDDQYADLYAHRNLIEAARAVRLLHRVLRLEADMAVLDLCCGPGRHLHFLGRGVRRAVGLDLSPALLRRAALHWRADDIESEEGLGPSRRRAMLVRADMRRLPLADASFDRVVNLFTSFGYFMDDADNHFVLEEISRVLRTGGMLAIDLMNREALLANLVPFSERLMAGKRRLVERRRWDHPTRRIVKEIELFDTDGSAERWHESVRVYDPAELESMLRAAGLEPADRFGDYDGSPWAPESPRLLVIARKQ